MEEVYHCAARPRRHFHMLRPWAHGCPSCTAQAQKAYCPHGVTEPLHRAESALWPGNVPASTGPCIKTVNSTLANRFFSHSRLHIVAVQHTHMGIPAALARLLDQRTPLCPTLWAGMTRNKHTQRTRNPLGGGFYTAQARALAAQSPRLCLPLAQHVGIIKNMLAAHPPAVVFFAF